MWCGAQWLAEAGPEREEALGVLRFWLGSIVVHARGRRDGSLPPIALVGTHKDKVLQGYYRSYVCIMGL